MANVSYWQRSEYQRNYQREYKRARRWKYVDSKECAFYGAKEKLQIHHVDPKDKDDHRIWSWSTKRLEAELEKCIILCQDCHWEVHRGMEDAGIEVTWSVSSNEFYGQKPAD